MSGLLSSLSATDSVPVSLSAGLYAPSPIEPSCEYLAFTDFELYGFGDDGPSADVGKELVRACRGEETGEDPQGDAAGLSPSCIEAE